MYVNSPNRIIFSINTLASTGFKLYEPDREKFNATYNKDCNSKA